MKKFEKFPKFSIFEFFEKSFLSKFYRKLCPYSTVDYSLESLCFPLSKGCTLRFTTILYGELRSSQWPKNPFFAKIIKNHHFFGIFGSWKFFKRDQLKSYPKRTWVFWVESSRWEIRSKAHYDGSETEKTLRKLG